MEFFDYMEVFYNQRRRRSTLGQSVPQLNNATRLRRDHRRALSLDSPFLTAPLS
jgi:hypothetical protein